MAEKADLVLSLALESDVVHKSRDLSVGVDRHVKVVDEKEVVPGTLADEEKLFVNVSEN